MAETTAPRRWAVPWEPDESGDDGRSSRCISEEGVGDVGLPARHGFAVYRDKPRVAQPMSKLPHAVKCQHAAPQMPVQRRVAGLPPAGRNDDAPTHRVPNPPGGPGIA